MKKTLALSLVLSLHCAMLAPAASRLKELTTIEGVRDNQLMGYGLVVGLAGTGDRRQTLFSAQSLANLLERMGITVPATAIQVKNTASVMITAVLPPFARPGSRIDCTIAAMGDSSSLQGGVVLMTGLKAPDGQTYAVAQGPLVIGGFSAGGAANGKTVNHPTVGRIPNGAIIERPSPSPALGNVMRLQLNHSDFTTASRISEAINKRFGQVAHADDAALVSVTIPAALQKSSTEFVAELENLTVDADRASKIVVNERTGTIVMGKEVRISPVAILQGNLSVEIQTSINVTQPNPMSSGTTAVTPQVRTGVKEEQARNVILKQGATVEELVRALTSIGSTPRDIIAILQNLKNAGALEADLEVI